MASRLAGNAEPAVMVMTAAQTLLVLFLQADDTVYAYYMHIYIYIYMSSTYR